MWDLTVDRKFAKKEKKKKKMNIFWFERFSDSWFFGRRQIKRTPTKKSHTLMETGNKKERMTQRIEKEFGSIKGGCDCCGREERIPWKKDWGLCRYCAERIEKDRHKENILGV